jgi:hypothetical protein
MTTEHQAQIHHLLLLNRHSHGFFAVIQNVRMEHWGGILVRIRKADCNSLVKKLVRQAVSGGQPRPTPAPNPSLWASELMQQTTHRDGIDAVVVNVIVPGCCRVVVY